MRCFVIAALLASGALTGGAQARSSEEPLLYDSARPAVGAWIGHVSWNDPIVTYGWSVYPDGTFSSGRLGRGENGGGTWSTSGVELSLKYSDGFRYVGTLHGDVYTGTAYAHDGRARGGFSMLRAQKTSYAPQSEEE
jgi:hypothetical protein